MTNIRQRLLHQPAVYRTFKYLIAPPTVVGTVVSDHLNVPSGARVLDVGCGFGDYAGFFADQKYTGIDHNESYIEMARSLNPGADFLVADVADPVICDSGPYDLVFLSGVLHHLRDDQVRALATNVAAVLHPDGRFVAAEPVFHEGQRLSSRLLIAADRGQSVRDERGYTSLLDDAFGTVNATYRFDLLRVPYSHLIIEARSRADQE